MEAFEDTIIVSAMYRKVASLPEGEQQKSLAQGGNPGNSWWGVPPASIGRNYVNIFRLERKQKQFQIYFEFALFSFFLTHLELKR